MGEKIENPSPEEQKAEQEALKEAKEEEIRTEIIAEFGFDEVDDAERIEKAVKREVAHRGKLSEAIGQKIRHRTAAQKLADEAAKNPPEKKPPTNAPAAEDLDKTVDEKVEAKLEQRDLDSLEYPDELKAEIKKIAKANGTSIKAALQDPYIKFKIEAYEKEAKTEEAAVSRNNKNGGKKPLSLDNPPEVDMSTPEGRKEYDTWVEAMKKAGH